MTYIHTDLEKGFARQCWDSVRKAGGQKQWGDQDVGKLFNETRAQTC
jgi:hypothetical protein